MLFAVDRSCLTMADSNSKIEISKHDALEHAKNFIGARWLSVDEDDVSFTELAGGYSAMMYVLEDLTGDCDGSEKVLVRLLGGKFGGRKSTDVQAREAIIAYKMGVEGLGPKLLGLFDGGRLEEYIPSRTLTTDDLLNNREIRMQIARKIARNNCKTNSLLQRSVMLIACKAYANITQNFTLTRALRTLSNLRPNVATTLIGFSTSTGARKSIG